MRTLLAVLCLSQTAVAETPYTYSPEHKRDPFANLMKTPPPPSRCGKSLCRTALAELRLVAIVGDGPGSVAMFEDSRGTGLLARRNAEIGLRGGRISAISRDCVTITEHFLGADGRRQDQKTRVCLGVGGSTVHELLTDREVPIP